MGSRDGDREVRVGVVGVGHVGQHHARIYAEMPGVRLVGVADIDPDRRQEVGGRLGVPGYARAEELLGQTDAVSIAVPAQAHHRISKEFLAAGVDVLVEKPIAGTVAEADELVAVAQARGRILQVGHIERFNAGVRALQQIVREPGFIEVNRLGPFAGRGTDVDVVLDLMIHDIDIILSLVRSRVRLVNAVGVPVLSDQVDIANARILFESGCVANVTASRVSFERVRTIRVFQRDTYISLDYATQEITLYRRLPPPPGAPPNALPQIVRGEVAVDRAEPLRLELESFIACVRDRTPPVVSGEEAREALKLAAQIIRKI